MIISRYIWKNKIILLLLILSINPIYLNGQSYSTWSLNTFPGPGHKSNPGPWKPGQGASRSEVVNDFGVSPVNGNFMIMITDLANAVYTNSHHPFEFVIADIPVDGGCLVAFSDHDPKTGFVLLGDGPGDHNKSGLMGWWKTLDEGVTWDIWYSDQDMNEKTLESYGRPWGKHLLSSDPFRKNILFFGSFSKGLVELDIAEKYDKSNPGKVIAFEDLRVKTIEVCKLADSTLILAIVQNPLFANSADKDNGGDLYSLVLDSLGNITREPELLSAFSDWTDIELDHLNPGNGFAIRNFGKVTTSPPSGLVRFTGWGKGIDQAEDVTPAEPDNYARYNKLQILSVLINPANSDHVVLNIDNGTAWQCGYDRVLVYSSNANEQEIKWKGVNRSYTRVKRKEYVDDFRFYGPPNHHSVDADYAFCRHDKGFSGGIGKYGVIDFVPGDPVKVRLWGGNWAHRAPMESNDFGKSFVPFAHGGTFKIPTQVSVIKSDDNCLHLVNCCMENGIYVSHDAGLSWKGYTHENNSVLHSIKEIGEPTGTIYKSKSGWGAAFKPDISDKGKTIVACYGLVNTDGKYESFIIRSENGGSTWIDTGERAIVRYSDNNQGQYGTGHHVHWGKCPDGSTAIYVGNKKSTNDGRTWSELEYDVFSISSADASIVLGTKYRDKDAVEECTFFYSLDGGITWRKLTGPTETFPKTDMGSGEKLIADIAHFKHFIAIDPTSKEGDLRVLVAGSNGIYEYEGPGNEGVWKGPLNDETTGNGIPLRRGFLNIAEKHFEVDVIYFDPRPGMDSIVYCGNSRWVSSRSSYNDEFLSPVILPYRRVFMSTDKGRTWSSMITDNSTGKWNDYIAVYDMAIDSDGKMYVTDWGGIFIHQFADSSDAKLSYLEVDNHTLEPVFDPRIMTYHVQLTPDATCIPKIHAIANNPNAKIEKLVPTLTEGQNNDTAKVLITSAKDEAKMEYEIIFIQPANEIAFYENEFEVYPNPVGDWLSIKSNVDIVQYAIIDIKGNILISGGRIDTGALCLQSFSPGFYMLKIRTIDKVRFYKFLKN